MAAKIKENRVTEEKYGYRKDTISTGHRCKAPRWAQFRLLAGREGITANAALNRCIDYCIQRGWIPAFIPTPQLPLEIPVKEQEDGGAFHGELGDSSKRK